MLNLTELLVSLSQEQAQQLAQALACKMLCDFSRVLDPNDPFTLQYGAEWEKVRTQQSGKMFDVIDFDFSATPLQEIFKQMEGTSFEGLLACSKEDPSMILAECIQRVCDDFCWFLGTCLSNMPCPSQTTQASFYIVNSLSALSMIDFYLSYG